MVKEPITKEIPLNL